MNGNSLRGTKCQRGRLLSLMNWSTLRGFFIRKIKTLLKIWGNFEILNEICRNSSKFNEISTKLNEFYEFSLNFVSQTSNIIKSLKNLTSSIVSLQFYQICWIFNRWSLTNFFLLFFRNFNKFVQILFKLLNKCKMFFKLNKFLQI